MIVLAHNRPFILRYNGWSKIGSPVALIAICLGLLGCESKAEAWQTVSVYFRDKPVELTMAGSSQALMKVGGAFAATEIKRLEVAFDPLHSDGLIYSLNQERTSRDLELIQLLDRGKAVSEMTGGRFSLFLDFPQKAYGFGKKFPEPPTRRMLSEIMLPIRRATLEIVLEAPLVRMPNDSYGVALEGLLDGYVVDQALAHLRMAGMPQGKVHMGGYAAFGLSVDGLGWAVEIMHPLDEIIITTLHLENIAMATSSITDDAFVYRNQSYYNNLDPITGKPARQLMNATIIAPTSEMAGALAKGIFTMIPSEGIYLINELPEIEGMLIDAAGRVWQSDGLYLLKGGS